MDWKEKRIQEDYNGDKEAFEKDYAEAVKRGRRNAVSWNDLLLGATTFPEIEVDAKAWIEVMLGYLPHDSVIIKYEPYARAIVLNHNQGHLNDEQFYQQMEEHIKLIRNDDLEYNTCLEYGKGIYMNYHETFETYGQIVKDRLLRFLGYVPTLEHSLVAEMWMREILSDDTFQLPTCITPVDYKAITLIKYREVLIEHGLEAANASPLPKLQFNFE